MKTIRLLVLLTLGGGSLILSMKLAKIWAQGQDEYNFHLFHTGSEVAVTMENIIVEKMDSLGSIVGSYRNDKNLYQNDIVYLKLPGLNVSVGDRFSIVHSLGGVAVPDTFFGQTGENIHVKGNLVVTKVLPTSIVAMIIDATEDIHLGDKITPPINLSVTLKPQEPSQMIQGIVLGSSRSTKVLGAYEFVFLNKGAADGLRLNDKLYVYRVGTGKQDGRAGLPEINMAELVIANVTEHHATAYVLGARESFGINAKFKSAISEVKYLN